LFDHDIFAHDKPVGGHFTELWQDAIYMFVGIYEAHDNRELATGFDQMRGMHLAAAKKSRNGMKRDCSGDTLTSQVFEQFQVQRAVMP